jgi:hypothetical protein
VIVAAAFCPHPPLLVPEISSGAAAELEPLRAACDSALTRLGRSCDRLVVVGSGPASAFHSPVTRGTLDSYGVSVEVALGSPACGGAAELPLSLTIGAWLLRRSLGERSGAVGVSVGPGFASTRAALELLTLAETQRLGLVVMGDGSARRSVRAPGYLDERAEPLDAAVGAMLRSGDGDALANLDEPLGEQLLAAGVPAWRAAGAVLAGGDYDAELLYSDAPYGVGYFVAYWTARG